MRPSQGAGAHPKAACRERPAPGAVASRAEPSRAGPGRAGPGAACRGVSRPSGLSKPGGGAALTQQPGGRAAMSWYRNAVWFLKGLREYTRSGYESASKHFVPADLEVNVTGRSFMITGANSGIGKAAATEIAKRGGTLHLLCRNKERAEEAKSEIITETGNQNVFLHILDMSNPKGIWEFAEKFKTEHKLNVLINNAGCMVNERELTEDGLEKNFATNTLGTYVLTTALLPLLEKEDDPRVITVSSGGMLVQKLDVSDLQSGNVTFDGTMVYAQNKL
ncbi:dehydrogenase/reductase SDR family member 12 isoform X2 [Pelodiscus sinensis]|uniref:dehydrogenase/reductase SDR family member 12 isoform X2 n=1 Tax=Pelodiscus sinensis TaxID=13735 RepID=UPI003F6AC58E